MSITEQVVAPTGEPAPPAASRPHVPSIPESFSYRMKRRLLGQPLHSDRLEHETLGKPTALAVFASDNLSSCAYATEEILHVLVPVLGVAAFTLITPITVAMIAVLALLILSYRQTIKAYPSAGGAYIVTRDNFGMLPAQVAGVALLTDYVLTVSVSTAAGSAALASAFPELASYTLWIAVAFVVLIAYGNLRGTKESGKLFAAPTYFFIGMMGVLLVIGVLRAAFGSLPVQAMDVEGMVEQVPGRQHAGWLFQGAGLLVVLRAFASGGAAVTGVEAISNGVPAFRAPAWRNARETLVVMGSLLGVMFLGLSFLASRVHATPYEDGTPTVISQVGKLIFGEGPVGHALFFALQAATMMILVLAANTSFADFPRLASFAATDSFMPRPFMVRGHRLVFSNGIIFLAAAAIVTLIGTGAEVNRLIPLYAVGVFTSFTLSQAGMTKHHIRLKEPGWRSGVVVNGIGAIVSFVVLVVIAAMKFMAGAWVIMLIVPILVAMLVRLNHAYEAEREELHHDAALAAHAPLKRRHTVVVLVDELDAAAARAMQYGRSFGADDLRAVHFDIDAWKTQLLVDAWQQLGLSRFPLDIVDCPDRRVGRAAVETCHEILTASNTELTVLIPRHEYSKMWHRLLHDRSSNNLAASIAALPHCSVTIVPYQLGARRPGDLPEMPIPPTTDARVGAASTHVDVGELPSDRVRVATLSSRRPATVAGRVRSMRVQPWSGTPSLECTLADETGAITVVWFGRRQIGGIRPGTLLTVTGVAGTHHGSLAMLNPQYEILKTPAVVDAAAEHH